MRFEILTFSQQPMHINIIILCYILLPYYSYCPMTTILVILLLINNNLMNYDWRSLWIKSSHYDHASQRHEKVAPKYLLKKFTYCILSIKNQIFIQFVTHYLTAIFSCLIRIYDV